MKESPDHFLTFSAKRGHSEKTASCKLRRKFSPDTESGYPRISVSRTVRDKFQLVLSHPFYGSILQQLEYTETDRRGQGEVAGFLASIEGLNICASLIKYKVGDRGEWETDMGHCQAPGKRLAS